MSEKDFFKKFCLTDSPSGNEDKLFPVFKEAFSDECKVEMLKLNNMCALKKGIGRGKIMLMAHADEVFMVVKDILQNGFLSFKAFGIDVKTLVSEEVVVHGKKDILGIIGIKPPHLMNDDERKRAYKEDELLIDTGYSKNEIEKIIKKGDYVTLKRNFCELLNNNVSCKAVDDRAGIAAMLVCKDELANVNHDFDVYFVGSCQEELGHRGAKMSSFDINPDIGIAIDVTFDSGRLGDEERENKLGKGPSICVGPNVHIKLRKMLSSIADEYDIPYQVEVEPGNTGTDAWDIQVSRTGIPSLLISIPIRYMHTSCEVVNFDDIKNTGRLIAKFIQKLKYDELEELLCY